MRIAVINRDKCKKAECGYICQRVCPGVRMGEETIVVAEDGFPVINEELCTGCGICVKKCPYNAISIVNLPEMEGDPVHQYGVNGFRVFGLPVPKEGVVSLIGPNGIGKTTIMKILSGQIVPNLGKENADWDQVLERFKGHEIMNYLLALKTGEIRVSFKPQEIGRIRQVFDGTVEELIRSTPGVDEEKAKRISEKIGISQLWGRKVRELAGGELQKLALTVALSRSADLFFLDEPTNFLDIRERMKIARLISDTARENKIMLVEHDLVILDYLSDWVHIMFGKPATYGIVSSLKSAKKGVNEFLDGYLRAENTRIRGIPIKFEVKPPADEWKGKLILEYPSVRKTYPHFELVAEPGDIREGEVIGIIGPNSIGKSTFISILAGKMPGDSGMLDLELEVAYKPQHIDISFDGTVKELLNEQRMDGEVFSAYIKPQLVDIYTKEVGKLSGGELQRLAIGITLARKADIYLLDEPTAYLDIEQRLQFSDIIRTIAEKTKRPVMVIDHDITFIDYVSNRLIVFDGTPGKQGFASRPLSMRDGMNRFLEKMRITFRRDPETGRPRINKPGSQKDKEQKESGEYYYMVG